MNYISLFFDKKTKKSSSRSDKGFTLVELVVAITIIVIITTIAISSVNTLIPRSRVKSVSREIAANINNAKNEAIKRNLETLVVFSAASATNKGSCTTCIDNNADGSCSGPDTILRSYTIKNDSPASISSTSIGFANGYHFSFNPRGLPVADDGISTSSGKIKINGKNGFSISVEVSSVGRIKIN